MERNPNMEFVVPAKRYRLPTADEAFKYTPITSSPLPASDVIPLPRLAAFSHNEAHSSPSERKAVGGIRPTPDQLAQINELLQPKTLPLYKFRASPYSNVPPAPLKLSPLARQVLESTDVEFTTPDRHQRGVQKPVQLNRYPSNVEAAPSGPGFVVEVPQPTDFRREDYTEASASPKRRNLNHGTREADNAQRIRSQNEAGDQAILQLHDLLYDIFEAQDHLESEVSNGQPAPASEFFEEACGEESLKIGLSSLSLERLEAALKRVVSLKRLDDIPSESLTRLQNLCVGPIESSNALNLHCGHVVSEEDRDVWMVNIRKADLAASTAIVFLYTLLGSRRAEATSPPEVTLTIPALLERVFDFALTPVIEARPDGQTAHIYDAGLSCQQDLRKLMDTSKRLLDVLASTCVEVPGAGDCVNTTEFRAVKLLFIQNAANDKQAALGSNSFERLRKQAMSCLARLYAAFPRDRSAILDEILSLLDKLPSTSRSARQHKLSDGRNVMLISSLFVQLVQTAVLQISRGMKQRRKGLRCQRADAEDTSEEDIEDEVPQDGHFVSHTSEDEEEHPLTRLQQKADGLFSPAVRSGQEIVLYMVGKASKVTKSGDSPYRNILDLFIEDLINLVPLSEWPAAELMLRMLAAKMTDLATNEKAAGIKNMALESLGTMGSAISAMRANVQNLAANLSRELTGSETETARLLVRLANDHFSSGLRFEDLVGQDGPFAITCHYYQQENQSSLRARAYGSFFLTQYAKVICTTLQAQENDPEVGAAGTALQNQASEILEQVTSNEPDLAAFSQTTRPATEARLAYLLCLLNLGFCRRYESIVRTLLLSLSSDQAQVRSRSLKSVVTMLETDASLLDRDPSIADEVFKCASDDSALVRDAASSLIAKFIVSKPNLEQKAVKQLLLCASDNKVGVQKRAIHHLADIYSKDARPAVRRAIARTLLQRTADVEDSVADLAKRTLTDAWITPNASMLTGDPDVAKSTVAMENFVSHIVDTLDYDLEDLPPRFTSFMSWSLKNNKMRPLLDRLLRRMADVLFHKIIAGKPGPAILRTLMSITEASPLAVAPQQLAHLRSYLQYNTEEELELMKCVIGIYRQVLPYLSSSHEDLLASIQISLFGAVNKLTRTAELDEVMSCLRTIDGVLSNSTRLVNLLRSVVGLINKANTTDSNRLRLIRIIGSFGKHIDLERLSMKQVDPEYAGGPVSSFLTSSIYRFAVEDGPESLKKLTLESLGAICQSHPAEFNNQKIRSLFGDALTNGDRASVPDAVSAGPSSQVIALRAFEKLFGQNANSAEEATLDDDDQPEVQDLKKMGGNAKLQDDNSAVTSIADYIKKPLVDIAFNGRVETTLLALRTLSNIAKRGMFHPRDYAAVFVALEASPEREVRDVAGQAHQLLHQQHETHWDREYINAVYQAFKYQQRVSNDPAGDWQGRAKLATCFAVINTSGTKVVKKFLSNLVSRLNTDLGKLDLSRKVPDHILFVRYICQNIAFFEYTRMDDLLHVVLQLELMFSKTGAEVSQAIELAIDVHKERNGAHAEDDSTNFTDQPDSEMRVGPPRRTQESVDPQDLRRLAAAACAVMPLYETIRYLRKLYNIGQDVRAMMHANKQSKDAAKAPLKVYGVTGEIFWGRTTSMLASLDSEEAMLNRCLEFHKVMSVDEEVRVSNEAVEDGDGSLAAMEADMPLPTPRGRKRKGMGGSASTTPSKRARGRARKNGTINGRSSSASSREDPEADYFD